MTKLEWCRANAPDSFKGLSNDELLQAMEPMIHSGFVDVPDFDTEEADVSDAYSVLMSKMDKIVLMLVREYGNKLAFTVERMLSDKVTAILSRKRFRRPKYIYDVYCLTTALITKLQLATRYPEISGIGTWKAYYYFDPFYNQYFDPKPSPACPTILEPTQERAICETIILKEHFDEGVLIESIKDYLYYHESTERLYDVMRMFVPSLTKLVDYWLKEAEEDVDE